MSVLTIAPLPIVTPVFNGPWVPPLRRFTVDEYHRMIDQGVFAENENFELIDGLVVQKMSKNPPHESTLQRVLPKMIRAVPSGWSLRPQQVITLSASEPEPDFSVVRGDDMPYRLRHPRPSDIGMLIEVSDTSLDYDRGAKLVLFARDRIPIYWIINLVDNIIEVYTQPSGPTAAPAYASRQDFALGDSIPLVLDGTLITSLPVSDLLP